jgi:hypothetical protein
MNSTIVQAVAIVLVCLVAARYVYRVVKNGGLEGAAFGARASRRGRSLVLRAPGALQTGLRVYVLKPEDERRGPHIGMEVSQTMFWSGEVTYFPLSREEAKSLAEELSNAVRLSETDAVAG